MAQLHQAARSARQIDSPAAELAHLVENILVGAGSGEAVLSAWTGFLNKHPKLYPAHFFYVVTIPSDVNPDALASIDALIALDPGVPVPYGFKANIYSDKGDGERALEILDAALLRFPASSWLRVLKIHSLGELKRTADQRAVLNELMTNDPYYPHVMRMMAEHLLHTGDEEALADVLAAIRSPTTPSAKQVSFARRYNLWLYGLGRVDEADEWIQFCIERSTDEGDYSSALMCHNFFLQAHYHLEDYASFPARYSMYRDAYDRPEVPLGLRNFAMSQGLAMHGMYALRSGDLEKATSLFERLQQAAPEDFGVSNKDYFVATTQASLASAKGAYDEAIQHIEGMPGERDSCGKRYHYAMVFYQNERYDVLEEELRSFVKSECEESPMLNIAKAKYVVAMASIHAAAGRTEQAKSLLEQYKEIWPAPDAGLPLVLRANKLRAELGLTGD